MIKMIGLDLDGTLLTEKKKLTDANKTALEEAWRSGAYIVPVTGRPLKGIPHAVRELPFIKYVITSNGAVTTDREKGEAIRERCMTTETAEAVLRAAHGEDTILEYFARGTGFHDEATRNLLWKRFEGTPILHYLEESRKKVEDFFGSLRACSDGIENLSVMCTSQEARDKVIENLGGIDQIRIILPWKTDIEIVSSNADKGEALLALAEGLGLARDEVMAMGDGCNDIGMMKAAGLSVAMGNSTDEVLEAADFSTLDNDHDGVAHAINQFVLGKGEQ